MSKYKIGYFDDIVDVDDYIERNGEFISNSEIVDILNEQEEEITIKRTHRINVRKTMGEIGKHG